jgi:hypothetical protein
MKTYHALVLFGLALALAFLSTGCATQRPRVDTWRNPQYSPTPADKIALTDRPNPKPQDATLGRLLVAELQRKGFALVPSEQADYLLTYVVSVSCNEEHRHVSTTVVSAPSQVAWDNTTMPQAMPQAWNSSVPPTVYVNPVIYRSRDLRLYLYTNPKTHSGNFQMVWQGNITTELTASPERDSVRIRTLLGYFGKDQNGRVDLAP